MCQRPSENAEKLTLSRFRGSDLGAPPQDLVHWPTRVTDHGCRLESSERYAGRSACAAEDQSTLGIAPLRGTRSPPSCALSQTLNAPPIILAGLPTEPDFVAAPAGAPLTVCALTCGMHRPASRRLLVPPTYGTQTLLSRCLRAIGGAVDISVITGPADADLAMTASAVEDPMVPSQKGICLIGHAVKCTGFGHRRIQGMQT